MSRYNRAIEYLENIDEVESKIYKQHINIKLNMTGVELIAQERLEQKTKHGRGIKYDVLNNADCQLANAAQALLEGDITWMPDSWEEAICERMIGKTYQERLVIAGALIAAELDRLNFTE